MNDLVHKNRATISEIAARFYVQNHWTFCHQNRGTAAKIAARFDSIRSRLSFSKSVFFTISRVKFKPIIGFWCRFRLHATHTWLYRNLQKFQV